MTDGVERVGRRIRMVEETRPGNVALIEPNEEHWQGAAQIALWRILP